MEKRRANTTWPSSGGGIEPVYRVVTPISSVMIPVEVFVLFLIRNDERFTICSLIDQFESRHRIRLKFARMQQIVNDLVITGKVKKTIDTGRTRKNVSFYSFNSIA